MGEQVERRDDERLLTPTEVAEKWGLSEGWLARRRSDGLPPDYVKLGKGQSSSVRYRLRDIMAWIEASTIKMTDAE